MNHLGSLIVFVSGLGGRPSKWDGLLDRLRKEPEWPDTARVLKFDHGSTIFSRKSANRLSQDLAEFIQTDVETHGPFDEIVLVGHSMGALLVRQAYLIALGSRIRNLPPSDWAIRVSRIVLFSGINRGLRLSLAEKLARVVLLPGQRLLRDLLIGSDFVTNLRIWWMRKLAQEAKRPLVIQLRGGKDSLVEEDDSLDVEGFLEGHQMFVQEANHEDIISPDTDGVFSQEKYDIQKKCVLQPFADSASVLTKPDDKLEKYFVVHGIRDSNNDWVADISTSIPAQIPNSYVIPPTYGRFSALQFLIPFVRRSKVRWFQDLYSMELSKNPLTKFHFIGHSYGTYLLGHGVSQLSGMEFGRVLLASSVLPSQLTWDNYRGQIAELRNSRAQRDVPVGILCSALRGMGMADIGTAGYTGFRVPFGPGSERFFYDGGHGATVDKPARPDILNFLRSGTPFPPHQELVGEDSKFSRLSADAPMFIYALLLLFAAISFGFTFSFGNHTIQQSAEIMGWLVSGFLLILTAVTAFI